MNDLKICDIFDDLRNEAGILKSEPDSDPMITLKPVILCFGLSANLTHR
jgi:hypothetical protein